MGCSKLWAKMRLTAFTTKWFRFLGFAIQCRVKPAPQIHAQCSVQLPLPAAAIPEGSAWWERSAGWKAVMCRKKTAYCGKVITALIHRSSSRLLYSCNTKGKYKSGYFEIGLQQCQQTVCRLIPFGTGRSLPSNTFNSERVTSVTVRASWTCSPFGYILLH